MGVNKILYSFFVDLIDRYIWKLLLIFQSFALLGAFASPPGLSDSSIMTTP